ncbi:uncharacterized protein L969DRAFT_96373 [Mixia osmundae IAM 14324]|uniref:Uncharacterized protein n=1 Tax=Mixia osmundae (strain CBS 9802 / IAM 14324 / JCM 22182 / KY 12970) TaxID=764103 RepID=G7DWE0_MIXOS|nr:uncharacterized protein L969DRAFT_96373 [Mixia osmundae IAM 14324]KEI37288.1 hypothetical protein L969DRAFT_96373 [Mixia osmundae IAM 14324]GAA94900.1 hypothetical protein E5Q_01555 [Mixia osmundae IAM 14324]
MNGLPPPAYEATATAHARSRRLQLLDLPHDLILRSLACLSSRTLAESVRPSCRLLWLFASHLLRQRFVSSYADKVQPGLSSDPLDQAYDVGPMHSTDLVEAIAIPPRHRETQVLDQYAVLMVRINALRTESELHGERNFKENDLFSVDQPRARLEDLTAAALDELVDPQLGELQGRDISIRLSRRDAVLTLPVGGPAKGRRPDIKPKRIVQVKFRDSRDLEGIAVELAQSLIDDPPRLGMRTLNGLQRHDRYSLMVSYTLYGIPLCLSASAVNVVVLM